MELYSDDFIVIKENTEENYTIYADMLLGFFPMSIAVGRFIAKKLMENKKHGYFLLDCAKKIFEEKGLVLYEKN